MAHRPPTGRHRDALLAGVCATLAERLGWNVWAVRALAVLGLFVYAIGTAGAYLLIAVVLYWLPSGRGQDRAEGLASPELSERNQRIEELERRFRELEEESPEQRGR